MRISFQEFRALIKFCFSTFFFTKKLFHISNNIFFFLAELNYGIKSFVISIMATNTSSSLLYPTINYESTSYIPDMYGSNYSNSNFTCAPIEMPLSNFLLVLLYAIVCIVGLMGNTLVIYVVLRFSNMQTVTNMYILNLAIADECYLIGIPFLIATVHIGDWIFGQAICKIYMVSTSITQFTSSIFLLIMSADRYIGKKDIYILV